MRTAFIQEFLAQARLDPDLFLVVGDLGYSVVEPFAREFPDRFLNAGVAEQNMTGVAAGLASEGWHVFTYSIANFPTLRCLEQIRNDVCYHGLPVTIVSVGGGLSYGNLGYSHHAVQDLGILRTFEELTILSPADPGETRECVRWLAAHPRPAYLRLGKSNEPDLYPARPLSSRPVLVQPGTSDVAIVATGSVLRNALEAAALAAEQGPAPAVFSCPWIQPVAGEFFEAFGSYRRLLVIEEHVAAGGLTALLQERLSPSIKVRGLTIPLAVTRLVGSQDHLRNEAGQAPAAICAALRQWVD